MNVCNVPFTYLLYLLCNESILALDLDELELTETYDALHTINDTNILGFEAVTGFRTHYLNKGALLSKNAIDFQLHGSYSNAENERFEYGTWYLAGSGEDRFTETGVLLHFTESLGDFDYTVGGNYRLFDYHTVESELELNAGVTYFGAKDHYFSSTLYYETEIKQFFLDFKYSGFYNINKNSYLNWEVSLGFSDNYYGEAGLVETKGRLSYTYNLTKQVSITPYVGCFFTSDEEQIDSGIWFETSF